MEWVKYRVVVCRVVWGGLGHGVLGRVRCRVVFLGWGDVGWVKYRVVVCRVVWGGVGHGVEWSRVMLVGEV